MTRPLDRDLARALVVPDPLGSAARLPTATETLDLHQGVVLSWNTFTNENSVLVAGRVLDDLPVILTADALQLRAGDVVVLVRWRRTFFVLGRVALPGTSRITMRYAAVPDTETATSTTPQDLATIGPEVTVDVSSSRRALVHVSARVHLDTLEGGFVWVSITGETTSESPELGCVNDNVSSGRIAFQAASFRLYETLNAGTNTFRLRYSAAAAGDQPEFTDRRLVVFPF